MKKFLAVFVAALVATMSIACFVSSAADMGPIGADLLADSGLGDPEYLYEEGIKIDAGIWLGHESWNPGAHWDGFKGDADGDGVGPFATTEIIDTTLSNGSTGKAIRFANDEDDVTGSQLGIESIDIACEFEDGKTYVAVATVKVSGERCNGHNTFIGFNNTECTLHGGNVVDIENTGEWQTVTSLPFEYVEANWTLEHGDGKAFLEIGFGENWIAPGYELLIESVAVYEYGEIADTPTGDASIIAVAVIAVALAAVVVLKKRETV